MDSTGRTSRTVSTKLKPEELERLDDLALERGVSRGYLIKELVLAGLEGRAILPLPSPIRGSIRDFGTSKAGKAALRRAREDAAAALDAGASAPEAGTADA